MEDARTTNLLGAVVLGVHDALRVAVEVSTGRSGETAAAIVALGHQPGLSNDALSQLLGLTHAGTVRLIDRLAADGLVERRTRLNDRRGVALQLTPAGEAMRLEVLQARAAALGPLVEALSVRDRALLADLTGKLLRMIGGDDGHKLRICRLCDGDACLQCPIHVDVGHGTNPSERDAQ